LALTTGLPPASTMRSVASDLRLFSMAAVAPATTAGSRCSAHGVSTISEVAYAAMLIVSDLDDPDDRLESSTFCSPWFDWE